MRTFKLNRSIDDSKVSGTGIVAEGVEFHDGQCVLSWMGQHHTVEISPSIQTIIAIHGHGGHTKVEFDPNHAPHGPSILDKHFHNQDCVDNGCAVDGGPVIWLIGNNDDGGRG